MRADVDNSSSGFTLSMKLGRAGIKMDEKLMGIQHAPLSREFLVNVKFYLEILGLRLEWRGQVSV